MSLTIGPWVAMRACQEATDHTAGASTVTLRLRLTQSQSSDGTLPGVINSLLAAPACHPNGWRSHSTPAR
ncbi:hypothetical protein H4W33_004695 [Kibdelosporangium phytohabitans]|uniref:hypothetical protein n=1 Tax=Kibdelosporangium phytohabitans TaxID=860235 RepID=UPI001470432A|nr:hypothetical protein [Kibdelosporangium phytohabitans]MBE1465683.1 hypothetical protein [Kibdelosporangium phytohabitans]